MRQRTIASRYALLEQLGSGSLWRARDTELERDVVLELLAPDEPASVAAQLAHPNIVHVFDQGESAGKRYEVREYVPGESLAQRLARGPLSAPYAQQLAEDVSGALAYAHEQGVAHGALGPESVLLHPDGRAKVTGFRGGAKEDDVRAFGALVRDAGGASPSLAAVAAAALAGRPAGAGELAARVAAAAPEPERPEPATAIVNAAPPGPRSRRRLAIGAGALVLAAAGVAAALLATSTGSEDPGSPAPVDPISTARREQPTEPVVPPPATTPEQTTTTPQTTVPETTAPVTTAPETTAPAPTEAPPLPLPTTEPIPTEPLPTPTEEPPPVPTDEITTTIELP